MGEYCKNYNRELTLYVAMKKYNKNLIIITLIAVVNMLGYGIIIPIIYAYSKRFGLSDFENGLLFTIYSICQFISTPIIGRFSDKFGRRPLLLVSIIGTAVSFFMMAFAPNALFLFIARALDGLTAGNIPVAFAVISDSTSVEERPRAFGFISAGLSFGFVFGPAVSALTADIGIYVPFLIAGVITTIAALLTFFLLPESNKHMGEVKRGKLFDFGKMWHTLFDPNVGTTFLISLVYFLAFSCSIIYGFQPFTSEVLRINASQNAMIFTLFGVVGLITQMLLVQRVTNFFGMKKAFNYSILLTGVALLLMSLSGNILMFVGAALFLALVNSVAQTLLPTILSREADAKSQGSIMGLNASYQSIGMIVGPLIGGAVATISVQTTFMLGFLFMLVCYFLSLRVLRTDVKPESAF